jgi:hypothetical protein
MTLPDAKSKRARGSLATLICKPYVSPYCPPNSLPFCVFGASSVEDPSQSLLRGETKTSLQSCRMEPPLRDLHSGTSVPGPSLLRPGLRWWTFCGRAFDVGPSPAGPSSGDLLLTFVGRPSPASFHRGAFYSRSCSGRLSQILAPIVLGTNKFFKAKT